MPATTISYIDTAVAGLLNLREALTDGLTPKGNLVAYEQLRRIDGLVWDLTETLRQIEMAAVTAADLSHLRANLRIRAEGGTT
jgi:hypothetical protein